MDVKDKQVLRNRISAMQSRLKKKDEVKTLNSTIKGYKTRMDELSEILANELC